MKRTVSKILIIIVISLSLSLFIAEILTGRFRHQTTYTQAYDSYNCYEKDDLLPFSLSKGKVCHMTSYSHDLTINNNSLGFRGKEIAFRKKEGTTRILALGDSMTFGVGVQDSETYPYQLEQILKGKGLSNIEVINAGYADGSSLDSYYLFLKKRGLELKPDIVLVELFPFNDISELADTIWEKVNQDGLPEKVSSCCFEVDGGIVRNKNIDFKYKIPALRESQLYLFILNTLQGRLNLFKPPGALPTKSEFNIGCVMSSACIQKFSNEEKKVYQMISAIKNITDKEGIKMVVVLLPVDHQLSPEVYQFWYINSDNPDFIQKRLAKNFDELGIRFLDLYPIFLQRKNEESPFLPGDIHFNPLGQKITAESIADYLKENKWIE